MAEDPLVLPQDEFEAVRKAAGRLGQDAATARTLLTPALLAELSRRLGEYENAITWNTTCLSCPAVLDSAAMETFRREAAEARLAAVKDLLRGEHGSWIRMAGIWDAIGDEESAP